VLCLAYSQVFLRARDIVPSRLTYIPCSENTLFARDRAASRDLDTRKCRSQFHPVAALNIALRLLSSVIREAFRIYVDDRVVWL
jgi:hypothetical protein